MISDELKNAILARYRRIPAVTALGLEIKTLDDGYAEARAAHDKKFDGVFDCFHGGMLMTVADTVACLPVMTKTGVDATLTTTDMNIRFLAPCHTPVTAKARVIKAGRTMIPVAVDLYDDDGKHVAVAQVNYMNLPRIPAR